MSQSDFDKLSIVLQLATKKQYHEAIEKLSSINRQLLSDKSKDTFDKVSIILSRTNVPSQNSTNLNKSVRRGNGLVYCILAMGHETEVLKMTVSPLIQQLNSDDAIYVLFNGFKDYALKTHLEKHTKLHVWESESNLGVAGGRNLLYTEALQDSRQFKYIITLDNDVIVPNDFNEAIKQELKENYSAKNIGILGGVILDFKKQKVKNFVYDNFLGFPGYLSSMNYNIFVDDIKTFIDKNIKKLDTILWHIGIDKSYQDAYVDRTDLFQKFRQEKSTYHPFLAHAPCNSKLISQKLFEVSNVPGCFQAISTENIERAGFLDERFSPYFFEDSEFSIRLMKLGLKNYISTNITLFHGTDDRHLDRKKISSKFDFIANEYRARIILFNKLEVNNAVTKLVKQSLVRYVTENDTLKALPEFVASLVGIRRGMIQLGQAGKIGDSSIKGDLPLTEKLKEFLTQTKIVTEEKTLVSFSDTLPPPDKGLPQVYFSKLKKFRNIYEGQDCLIVCNGPSLKDTNLGLFAGIPTFCVNSTFILQEQLDFRPNFFTVEDNHVIDDNLDNIKKLRSGAKFFPDKYRAKFGDVENLHYLPTIWDCYWKSKISHEYPEFSEDIARGVYTGQTVTYLNLQLAYYMGFKRVFIVGLDFSYSIPKGSKIDNNSIDHDDDDPNHFHASYFGKGRQWHFPKLDSCMVSYSIAKERFNRDGREVIDLTKNGCLNVFRRSTVEQELEITNPPKTIDKGLNFKQYLIDSVFAKYCINKTDDIDFFVNENSKFLPVLHEHIHFWLYWDKAIFIDSLMEALNCNNKNKLVAYIHEQVFLSSNCVTCNELPFCNWLSSQVNVKCAELTNYCEENTQFLSLNHALYLPNNKVGRKTLKQILIAYSGNDKVVVHAEQDKILVKYVY